MHSIWCVCGNISTPRTCLKLQSSFIQSSTSFPSEGLDLRFCITDDISQTVIIADHKSRYLLLQKRISFFAFLKSSSSYLQTVQKKLKLIFCLAFLQKSQLYLSESEFRIMKFYNSHIIPDLQNIARPKELVPHRRSLSNAWLHSSTASLSKVVIFDEFWR